MTITKREKIAQETLYQKGYKYLLNNFGNFSERNKIHIALTVYKAHAEKVIVDQSKHEHYVIYLPKGKENERKLLETPSSSRAIPPKLSL